MSDERAGAGGMALDRWLELVEHTLGAPLPAVAQEERALLLDLARVAARRCDRIAAPITAYAVGAALASTDAGERAARLERLVADLELPS